MDRAPNPPRDNERAAVRLAEGLHSVSDGWLGTAQASALRLEIVALLGADEGGLFLPAGVGGGALRALAPKVRADRVCWFDDAGLAGVRPGVQVALFLARLDGLRRHLNATCFLGLERVECHAACYEAGAFYAAHTDTLRTDDRRVISYCYYLNDAWTEAAGGCLRLWPAPHVDIAPLLDRLVTFRSADLRHEVLPTAERRLSLTGWLSRARAS